MTDKYQYICLSKGARHWESKNMNNEMEIETLETNLKEAKRIGEFNWWIGESENLWIRDKPKEGQMDFWVKLVIWTICESKNWWIRDKSEECEEDFWVKWVIWWIRINIAYFPALSSPEGNWWVSNYWVKI